ncbi:thioredoxin family protein [Rhodobacter sphaeroides]|jgi:small redox-active disulfide protein 2|uniref:Glutaredoxin family protein/Thio-disulfide isomerase n=1 Tax=Cereibacter sphaeroides (strain ATCC 17023 / DSM 158 / JCM 6121 / CCUG 31486 / LMG 2827 / NBRC 12203 / NCIMB 8253 / ATH 2.4.1.) TaxID=272943 RepID=Q3IUY1_CERS4|nr:thioredoxin family protein [Cereibacter sphaeroides]ABA81653.1 putative glutaredoxin family protein/Thio-disulfide isomerase [Cereibacter sphaeroides 2.4.1]AMJ49798.1 glutaredoxin [Cereibacter sphaeroides]ANS36557.1 glutaredoxin [Cereibacter sphaeroides]ATN65569.1 glutaredoxin [Cereibacter sphaeroides]AXC64178.1 thioredoxin family protein [Cereibacter sphaeroides 2.4.1]
MDIKVLGPGCVKCRATVEVIEEAAKAQGVPVTVTKVEGMREIVGYGVMSTPGVVVEGRVVHTGSVPTRDQVKEWLK